MGSLQEFFGLHFPHFRCRQIHGFLLWNVHGIWYATRCATTQCSDAQQITISL